MTTLEILLLIALIFAIICDIIRIVCWIRLGSGRSKENVKREICMRVHTAEDDWIYGDDYIPLSEYIEKNFDKYFD